MTALVGTFIFIGAFAASAYTIAAAVGPDWRRIVRLATGHVEPDFAPLETLAAAERRIAVRRWSAASVPASTLRSCAAA